MRITYAHDGSADRGVERLQHKLESAQSAASAQKTVEVFGEPLSPTEVVRKIVAAVKERGDAALFDYTSKLDGVVLTPETVRVTEDEFVEAWQRAPAELAGLVHHAAERVKRFQEHILPPREQKLELEGTTLRLKSVPYQRVGVCIPGWSAILPSSLVMTVVPARAAGVQEVAVVTPAQKDGSVAPAILVAARELGVDEVYKVGGAQAIAALAFGTESVRKVDKIVGPGNIFVTLAKKEVFGAVDIDMLAGPSEVGIVADESASPRLVAADMISQAEHGPGVAVLVTDSEALAQRVTDEVDRQLESLPRADTTRQCLDEFGLVIVAQDLAQACDYVNRLAPEHVEVLTENPDQVLERIRNAGAVFLGACSPVAVGDYMAGPSHVLPTGGSARSFSGLSARDFVRSMSVIECTPEGFSRLAGDVIKWANIEGLSGHARSVEVRLEDKGTNRDTGNSK